MRRQVVLAFASAVVMTLAPLGAVGRTAFEGRPEFKEGRELGYYVWVEDDTWHVRWTTLGAMRRFTGHVAAEGGDLKSLKRIDVETERRIVRPGRASRVVRGPRGRVRGVTPGRSAVVATKDQDHIEMDGDRRIRFSARTDDDIDGFDFKVTDNVRSLRFALEIDGTSRPAYIETGRKNLQPAGNPFVIELRP